MCPEYNVPLFRWIGQGPRETILLFRSTWKHKLCRGRWDRASCQVSLNSGQSFHQRSRKCLSQLEAGTAILTFQSARTYTLGRGHWDLASCQVSLNSVQRFQRRSWKCLSQSDAGAAILFFRSVRKRWTWVEDVETLLPVKFCWFPFRSFRWEVENVSANQMPGRPSCFSDRPKKVNSVEDVETLLPVKFCWFPFRSFRWEVEMSQPIRGRGGHLVFPIGPKTQTW